MKKLNETNACVWGIMALLAVGCGSEDKPATETTSPTNDRDAAPETTAPSEETTLPPGDTDAGPVTSPDEVGDPVLEEVPPATELSELDDEQRAEVCEAYVKTSVAVSANLEALCPTQGLFQAAQNEEVTDDESFRAECTAQVEACEAQVAAAGEDSPEERCASGSACGATIKEFNDCNRQIAALNRIVLEPLTEEEVSECSETTQAEASNTASELGITVLFGIAKVNGEAGGSPTDEDGPCARISEACPELGVALGAFSDLGSQLQ